MPWVKIDDGFYMHPKIIGLSPAAIGLHVCGLCYAADNLTDGHIPKAMVGRLTSARTTAKLVAELHKAGLWVDEGSTWRIHDFLTYQPSRAKVLLEREQAATRMAVARATKKARKQAEESGAVRDMFGRTSGEVRSTPTRPDPTHENPPTPQASA